MNESEPPKFFTDECLGRFVPAALKKAGMQVELYLDWFKPGVADADWIPVVSERGWLILTIDEQISRRIPQLAAILNANAKVFVMASSKVNSQIISTAFIAASSVMVRLAQETDAPFIVKVYKSGEVKLWRDRESLWDIVSKYLDAAK